MKLTKWEDTYTWDGPGGSFDEGKWSLDALLKSEVEFTTNLSAEVSVKVVPVVEDESPENLVKSVFLVFKRKDDVQTVHP